MFLRAKKSKSYTYLQIVENRREGDKVIQSVISNLGRLDKLQQSGQIDSIIASGIKFTRNLAVLSAHKQGKTRLSTRTQKIGPALLFEKVWKTLGIPRVIEQALQGRQFQFPIERAIFLTVLHRLFAPGSDRACEKWKQDYAIEGCKGLKLHHLYRTMGWLGDPVALNDQEDAHPNAFRTTKDKIEEALFFADRDLFTDVSLVFFDTTSIYFEGNGGTLLGQHGHSKDHRPDLRQLVAGVVLDDRGNPICCEILPGNTTDVTTLVPVAQRLKNRFGVGKVCIVADRGMVSRDTREQLENLGWEYILGARMRTEVEVRDKVLQHFGNFKVVHTKRKTSKDPSPLKVKEVVVDETRYVVCHNDEQAEKDRRDREAILVSLEKNLKKGSKSLVGNKGFRRYIKSHQEAFSVDEQKVKDEALYDGKWVLVTNTSLPPKEVALKYKELLKVESIFRTMKSILRTRPIFHQLDETITGHVFCSFLALKLRKHVEDKLEQRGEKSEWMDLIRDVDQLSTVDVTHDGAPFTIRTELKGVAGKAFAAMGVALPPVVRIGNRS